MDVLILIFLGINNSYFIFEVSNSMRFNILALIFIYISLPKAEKMIHANTHC